MAKRKRRAAKKRKVEWSKAVCLLAMLAGLLIVQECLFLMYLCIKSGYTAAAAWLTAATGVGEAIIIAGANGYLSLAKSDHKRGGITFEAAKANNLRTTRRTTAASTAPPSEYRPHNESPLAGFYRPVEGAFSVFRRFRVYGALWRFLRLGCASTLPRCKERVATRLRRRERCLRVAAALSFQKSHVSRSGTNSMIVPSGTGSQGSPSKALPCFVQMSAGLLRRGSTST